MGAGGGADRGATLREAGAALWFGSGGRLRFGGGGGWLTVGRACATAKGGSLGTGRGGAGGRADSGRRTGGGGGPEGTLRGAPTLASAFTGGPEFRFAVMPALHRPIARSAQITHRAKSRENASLFGAEGSRATVFDIGTVVFRCHGFCRLVASRGMSTAAAESRRPRGSWKRRPEDCFANVSSARAFRFLARRSRARRSRSHPPQLHPLFQHEATFVIIGWHRSHHCRR
jgi:hypothetical protein